MTDVLISAGDLADLASKEPCVIIDTRNPDAYGAGHLPNAVNVHEIFTYLATSTPEGIHELKTKFADAFGKAGLSGKETAVIYEQSMNSGFGQSCRGYYLLTMLGYPKVKVLDGGFDAWTAKGMPGHIGRAGAGAGIVRHRTRSQRHSDRRQDHACGGRQARHRIARCARCR
jgi:thiosulfate/3-mercaptopyruvate sulfurtransferase